ncbi:ssDNA binding protein-like protein Ssb3 [Patellaria atrata CBS 101060]|uniref:SsDNA binding protein-like protein Ssb3 n=1 Tax=Patellaria atrata CBS 101060 TaxID=1346257 RepID=A0A9P4S549_9PEZI|nr:ssDNA binding protein-like protein Ssb3 [Patellaria atrata CBS 101060]
MTESTPRITAQFLESFTHQTVRILGKVVQIRGEQATVDAGGEINVILNRDSHLVPNHAVEIIGKVQNDLTVRVLTSTDFGTGIDFAASEAVVDATHRYKEIFYGGDD